jgi:hypothetical protein
MHFTLRDRSQTVVHHSNYGYASNTTLILLLTFQTFDILSLYNVSARATDNKSIVHAHWNIILHAKQRYSTWSSDTRITYNKAREYQNLSIEYKIDIFAVSRPFAPCFTILSRFCLNVPLIAIMRIHRKNSKSSRNNYDPSKNYDEGENTLKNKLFHNEVIVWSVQTATLKNNLPRSNIPPTMSELFSVRFFVSS